MRRAWSDAVEEFRCGWFWLTLGLLVSTPIAIGFVLLWLR